MSYEPEITPVVMEALAVRLRNELKALCPPVRYAVNPSGPVVVPKYNPSETRPMYIHVETQYGELDISSEGLCRFNSVCTRDAEVVEDVVLDMCESGFEICGSVVGLSEVEWDAHVDDLREIARDPVNEKTTPPVRSTKSFDETEQVAPKTSTDNKENKTMANETAMTKPNETKAAAVLTASSNAFARMKGAAKEGAKLALSKKANEVLYTQFMKLATPDMKSFVEESPAMKKAVKLSAPLLIAFLLDVFPDVPGRARIQQACEYAMTAETAEVMAEMLDQFYDMATAITNELPDIGE